MIELTLAQRTQFYNRDLRRFQALQVHVANPYFNADREPDLWREFSRLESWLKKEADDLWQHGVNVYH